MPNLRLLSPSDSIFWAVIATPVQVQERFDKESALWLCFPPNGTSMLFKIVASQKCGVKELQLKVLTPYEPSEELASRAVEKRNLRRQKKSPCP